MFVTCEGSNIVEMVNAERMICQDNPSGKPVIMI